MFKLRTYIFRILALAILCIAAVGAKADGINAGDITITDHLGKGYISVAFGFYDDYHNDEYLRYSEDSYISINGVKALVMSATNSDQKPQHEGSTYWVDVTAKNGIYSEFEDGTPIETNTRKSYTKIGSLSTAHVRVYPTTEMLLTENISVEVHLDVAIHNSPNDYTVYKHEDIAFTLPEIDQPTVGLSTKPGFMTLTQPIKSNRKTSDDRVTFTDALKDASIDFLVKDSGTAVKYDYPTLNYKRPIEIEYVYVPSEHNPLTFKSKIDVPAFYTPDQINATQLDNGAVEITWALTDCETDDNEFLGDNWIVQRSESQDFAQATRLGTVPVLQATDATVSYRLVDNCQGENLNGTYYYRVYRDYNNKWGTEPNISTSIGLHMQFRYPTNATVSMVDDRSARVTWQLGDGNVWLDGTKITLMCTNLSRGGNPEYIDVPADSIASCSYTDQLNTSCDIYEYKLQTTPATKAYSQKQIDVIPTEEIYAPCIGEVISLTASKGYFTDNVTLKWTTDGGNIKMFEIESRIHDSGDNFLMLDRMDADNVSTMYKYLDTKALPGIIYDYRIKSITPCGPDNIFSYCDEEVGFRKATGEIYGRVTYESGQGVPGADVRAEAVDGDVSYGKAYVVNGDGVLSINDNSLADRLLNQSTLQAWINPKSETGTIIGTEDNRFALSLNDSHIVFSTPNDAVFSNHTISELHSEGEYIHVTGILSADSLALYVNGRHENGVAISSKPAPADTKVIMATRGYVGAIDEVRIWNEALTPEIILRDYNRHLVGNEKGLIGYYTFDYAVGQSFFDSSFSGTKYNALDGCAEDAELSTDDIPDATQLAYLSYTDTDGSYQIKSVPYAGNGTTYMVIPRMGNHSFNPEKELRLINKDSYTHTVNFTDVSSFEVSGKVMYEGGNIPVEGVSFYIDGVQALDSKHYPVLTGADGTFTISVPVGVHEVKASKAYHTFADGGKIINSDGSDRNYQDMVTGIELYDMTKVRYIGRVAGGTVQGSYKTGHSLSTNNLGDAVEVRLEYPNAAYTLATSDTTMVMEHFIPSNKTKAQTNEVTLSGHTMTIRPSVVTGEFVADVIPENFNVTVIAPGYEKETANLGGKLDLTSQFTELKSVYEYTDSVYNYQTEAYDYINYSDTVTYNKSQLFTVRVTPKLRLQQIVDGQPTEYFGDLRADISVDGGIVADTLVYDINRHRYMVGRPVFTMGRKYTLRTTMTEDFPYYTIGEAGYPVADEARTDRVPCQRATVAYIFGPTSDTPYTVTADEYGVAEASFISGVPDLTTATASISVTGQIDSDSPSISWIDESGVLKDVITLGVITSGNNFVTAGPNKILTVLRDPPGSKSYAVLEEGTTFTCSDTHSYGCSINFDAAGKAGVKEEIYSWAGVGAGAVKHVITTDDSIVLGLQITDKDVWKDSHNTTYTLTTKFQTSSDPAYVGADGDVFVGHSTNMAFGEAKSICLVSKDRYAATGGAQGNTYKPYSSITGDDSEYILVNMNSLSVAEEFATLFVYPQRYIEEALIPNLEKMKRDMLHNQEEMSESEFQALADSNNENVYVSKLMPSDPNYGRSNSDRIFQDGTEINLFDGPSYKIYVPKTLENSSDTILTINQWIDDWVSVLRDNERAKVEAKNLLKNISIHSGTGPVTISEAFSEMRSTSRTKDYSISGSLSASIGFDIAGIVLGFNTSLKAGYVDNTDNSSGQTVRSTLTCVLDESDVSDYLSIDILREQAEDSDNGQTDDGGYGTFVYRTRAGATSCPYEGEYRTKYYEPGNHVIDEATMQIEKPVLDIEEPFKDNVPSGESAYFTLYLRNDSEINEDRYYNLNLLNGSNPDGLQLKIDGSALTSRAFLVNAGSTLTKTLEVSKGAVLDYDNIKLVLASQCQSNPTVYNKVIGDTISFSVHFVPSATKVNISKPAGRWTYNTNLPTKNIDGVDKHYLEVEIDGFDVNYDHFNRIMLQYKPASSDDNGWITLNNYYINDEAYMQAVADGINAEMIHGSKLAYQLMMDDLQDQEYDLRALGVSVYNNEEVTRSSEVRKGIKDMYRPRLLGTPSPADGILTVNDLLKFDFNETIADGYITDNNFEVTGIRNGAQTTHSVSVTLDGNLDCLTSDANVNFRDKDMTVELWICQNAQKDCVVFSHGDANSGIELGLTADNHLMVKVGATTVISQQPVDFKKDEWAHVAMTISADGEVQAYYNFRQYISAQTEPYNANGTWTFGAAKTQDGRNFSGKMHNARVWDKVVSSGQIQTNSLTMLSGHELNLYSYYPMDEMQGATAVDKASGKNLKMAGCQWSLPEGRAITLDGKSQYVKISTGSSAVIDDSMDFTVELWFKGGSDSANGTLISNGKGDGNDYGGSKHLFWLGFDKGHLTFRNNGQLWAADGNYLDDTWHHTAVTVNRISKRLQIIVDGKTITNAFADNLGGISAAFASIGACEYTDSKADRESITTDRFWHGSIDEVRIWSIKKERSQIDNGRRNRLDGTETGLLAYYPFEDYKDWQGTKELEFTLDDKRQQADPAYTVTAGTAVGGLVESKLNAPVKDKGPVSKLRYEYVVRDNSIVINLTEDLDRIEGTTVNVAIQHVRDLNANEMVNPVNWSAYIDMSPMKWDESSVKIDKSYGKASSFKVDAYNRSGGTVDFSIDNLPAWLSASPAYGKIAPASTLTIEFTVDESLNIGMYNENVYLTDANGLSELLNIAVNCSGEKPDWSVNPAMYDYNMNLFGQIRIMQSISDDPEDMLAAFIDNECVGVSNTVYNASFSMSYVPMTIYSNEANGKEITFRIYDASTGRIYDASPINGINITFAADKMIGSASTPVVFQAKEDIVQTIDLNQGWQWVSINVVDETMSDLNASLNRFEWGTGDQIKDDTSASSAQFDGQGTWTGALTSLNNSTMYKIKTGFEHSIEFSGPAVDVNKTPLTIKGTPEGAEDLVWNYIPYLPLVNLPINEALSDYDAQEGDMIKSQNAFATYSKNLGWVGQLNYLEAGKGYMLSRAASDDVTFRYPKTTTSPDYTVDSTFGPEWHHSYYGSNMTVIATVKGYELSRNERLCAYVDGELRGIAKVVLYHDDGTPLVFVVIAGDEMGKLEWRVENNSWTSAIGTHAVQYTNDRHIGTIRNPYVIDLTPDVDFESICPTPYIDVFNIRFDVDEAAKVDVAIYDMQGRLMAMFEDCNNSGLVELNWDDWSSCPRGEYILRISINDTIRAYKVIKL